MEYSGEGVGVYAEAKGEYTRQLCQLLTPAFLKYFLEMLDLAKERESDPKKHLVEFQNLLEAVSEWNMLKVQRETQSVAIYTQCDYLEELLTAVFIAHTKVLSAIRLTNRQKKLQITIPKLEHFLHKTMTECARILWTNTFLFAASGTALERQKNMRQVENLINEGVLQGVRSMLPVKSILREYLTTEESGDETDVEADEEEGAEEETAEPEAVPKTEVEPAPETKPAPIPAPESRPSSPSPDLSGLTGATESIPVINLNDVPMESDSSLFKEAVASSAPSSLQPPPAKAISKPPTPQAPPTPPPTIVKEPAAPPPSLLEELEEVADLPIFEDDVAADAAKADDETDFEFEELS